MGLSAGDLVDGRYEIVRILEEAEHGCVADVEHVYLEQPFTLKLVYAPADHTSEALLRLRQEAKANSLVQHENAIFVTDVGRCEHHGHYLVTEPYRGERLSDVLTRARKLSVDQAIRILMDAGNAVTAAHQIGVIHKSLHPDNLRVDFDEEAGWACKVLGFGTDRSVIASPLSPGVQHADYRAPELRFGAEHDAKSDQFSLGSIAYRMLTGEHPDPGEVDDDDVRAPSTFDLSISAGMDAALLRSIRRSPNDRFESVEAYIDAIMESSRRGLVPRTDPMDETSQPTPIPADSMTEAGMGLFAPSEPASLVISVEDLRSEATDDRTRLTLTFQTHERLRREYRRNIIAGGLFVPTAGNFELQQVVEVDVSLRDEAPVTVRAEVVNVQGGQGRQREGVGLMLDERAVGALGVYLRERAGLELEPDDRLVAEAPIDDANDVSRAGAYLISRLELPRTVAELRREVAGLPFDLAQELARLVETGWVRVEAADSEPTEIEDVGIATEAPSEVRAEGRSGAGAVVDFVDNDPWRSSLGGGLDESSRINYTDNEIERVMGLVDYQVRRQNYLAALRTLQKAIIVSPAVVDFHHRLAKLHMQFTGNREEAMDALQSALQIEPDREDIRKTLNTLEKMRS